VQRPDTEIEASMSDIKLRLTQYQLKYLMEISKSVPAAFAGEGTDDEDAARSVDEDTLQRARTLPSNESNEDQHLVDLAPELGHVDDMWTKLDVIFQIHTIGLELIMAQEDQPVGDIEASSLSRFSLDDTRVKFRMLSDSSIESELLIQSFTINDSRPRDTNKYRRIMTSSNKEAQQLMASVTMSGGKERNVIAMATIDSPRVIFALDYLFAIQKFAVEGLTVDESSPLDDESLLETPEESDADSMQVSFSRARSVRTQTEMSGRQSEDGSVVGKEQEPPKMNIAFRVNLVDAQVILIANPLSSSSEAIVLGIRQVLLSQQHALTFQISEIGMYLCRMDKFETSRLRIIDDFSVQLSMDSSQPTLTSIHVEIEPLILRLSLRDILLALQIITKASELSSGEPQGQKESAAEQKARQLRNAGMKQRSASGRHGSTTVARSKGPKTIATHNQKEQSKAVSKGPQRREELSATVQGVRVVLIGDLHELPILDLGVKEFSASAQNWSSALKAEVALDLYINVYNFSKSSWEPLLEPWQVGFGVAKQPSTGLISVDVASKKTLDVSITTATIALASKSFDFLTTEQDVLDKPRGVEAPYRIRNYTGFEVVVHSKSPTSEEPISARLEDGSEAPWSFEHWEKMRENLLTESNQSNVAIQLEGSGFDPVKNVRLNREGEFLYSLRPKTDNITHRLCVEVSLGADNVKYVTLRSPLLVENATQIPVELGVYDAQDGHLLKIEKIAPGEARPAPVGAVYEKRVLVRPDGGFGYQWSDQQLWWKDLLRQPTKQVVCKGENGDPFYFQVNARFDRSNPMTK
jgi:vacuolar protein sorting-associated protein 13A/C